MWKLSVVTFLAVLVPVFAENQTRSLDEMVKNGLYQGENTMALEINELLYPDAATGSKHQVRQRCHIATNTIILIHLQNVLVFETKSFGKALVLDHVVRRTEAQHPAQNPEVWMAFIILVTS